MRYYSEKTNRFYETEQDCQAAETEFIRAEEEKQKKEEELKSKKSEVLTAIKDKCKELNTLRANHRKEEKEKQEELDRMIDDYYKKYEKANFDFFPFFSLFGI